jgi:hypothetical protein
MPAAVEELRARLAAAAGPTAELLPVAAPLDGLFPGGGLARGTVVGVEGSVWLALGVMARASTETGSWCAVVGHYHLGPAAAAEIGVDLTRLVLVPSPGNNGPTVVAALLDGVDIVLYHAVRDVRPADARRLAARARERRSVLLVTGRPWPEAVDLRLRVTDTEWTGLHSGYGRIAARHCRVSARGRGSAARERRVTATLPELGAPPAAVATAAPLPAGGAPATSASA